MGRVRGVRRGPCQRCPTWVASEVSDVGHVRGVRRGSRPRCPRCPTRAVSEVPNVGRVRGVRRGSCPKCPTWVASEVSDVGRVRGVRRGSCPRCPRARGPALLAGGRTGRRGASQTVALNRACSGNLFQPRPAACDHHRPQHGSASQQSPAHTGATKHRGQGATKKTKNGIRLLSDETLCYCVGPLLWRPDFDCPSAVYSKSWSMASSNLEYLTLSASESPA